MQTQYKQVVGILYNGEDIRVFKGEEEVKTPTKLQSVSYYLSLYTVDSIDKERIYELTAKINNGLHFEFGIKNLYHRMIFTACALVAERYGAGLQRLKEVLCDSSDLYFILSVVFLQGDLVSCFHTDKRSRFFTDHRSIIGKLILLVGLSVT